MWLVWHSRDSAARSMSVKPALVCSCFRHSNHCLIWPSLAYDVMIFSFVRSKVAGRDKQGSRGAAVDAPFVIVLSTPTMSEKFSFARQLLQKEGKQCNILLVCSMLFENIPDGVHSASGEWKTMSPAQPPPSGVLQSTVQSLILSNAREMHLPTKPCLQVAVLHTLGPLGQRTAGVL
jgi:hypothetical protein